MCITRYSFGYGYFVQYPCMSFTMKALAATSLGLHWSNIMVMLHEVMLWLCYSYIMVMLWMLLWLLHQPRERLCYGCHASQERIKESGVAQSCPTLCDPWTVAYQVPPSREFSSQDYGSGLPFPSSGDLPDPGIEPGSPAL